VRPWDFAAAEVYAVLGETDRAIAWLDRSMRKGDDRAAWLRIDPLLANVRQHPRFKQILNSMEFHCQQRIALPAKRITIGSSHAPSWVGSKSKRSSRYFPVSSVWAAILKGSTQF
jgi:hypothetical protein